jgi:hypothetical protein
MLLFFFFLPDSSCAINRNGLSSSSSSHAVPFLAHKSTFGLKMRVQVKKRVETKNTGSARVMQKGECTAPGNRYKASKTNKRKYTRARGRTHTASNRHRLRSFTKHKGKLCRELDRPMQDPTVLSSRGEITGPVGHRNDKRGVLPSRPRSTVCITGDSTREAR